jgi:hypothetical protein
MEYLNYGIFFFVLFFSIKIIYSEANYFEIFTICFIATILCYVLSVDKSKNYYGGFLPKNISSNIIFSNDGEIFIK